MDFSVVSDELRGQKVRGKYADAIDALLGGKTIFIPGLRSDKAAAFYNAAKRANRTLHSRQVSHEGQDGLVMWVDPVTDDA